MVDVQGTNQFQVLVGDRNMGSSFLSRLQFDRIKANGLRVILKHSLEKLVKMVYNTILIVIIVLEHPVFWKIFRLFCCISVDIFMYSVFKTVDLIIRVLQILRDHNKTLKQTEKEVGKLNNLEEAVQIDKTQDVSN